MLLKREIVSSYSKTIGSRPVAWAVREFSDNGTVRYLLSFRKSFNFSCLFFDSFSDLEHYTTSKGWV